MYLKRFLLKTHSSLEAAFENESPVSLAGLTRKKNILRFRTTVHEHWRGLFNHTRLL